MKVITIEVLYERRYNNRRGNMGFLALCSIIINTTHPIKDTNSNFGAFVLKFSKDRPIRVDDIEKNIITIPGISSL